MLLAEKKHCKKKPEVHIQVGKSEEIR